MSKYLAKVSFDLTIEVEGDSIQDALDNATLGTTLASVKLWQSKMCECYPSSAEIVAGPQVQND